MGTGNTSMADTRETSIPPFRGEARAHTSHTTPEGTTILFASDLVEKFGFGDGELLEGAIDALGIDSFMDVRSRYHEDPEEEDDGILCREALKAMVRRFLEPLLIGIAIGYDANRSHNPVRANSGPGRDGNIDDDSLRSALDGIVVEVTREQLRALVEDVVGGGPARLPASPT